jgi:hypothetical protein
MGSGKKDPGDARVVEEALKRYDLSREKSIKLKIWNGKANLKRT